MRLGRLPEKGMERHGESGRSWPPRLRRGSMSIKEKHAGGFLQLPARLWSQDSMCTAYERTFSHMTEDQLDSSTEAHYVTGHRMA
jgi:hypothetical protein